MRFVLGADIGTSSTKALLLSERGRIHTESSVSHPLYSPKPGFNEQNPEDWWKSFVFATRKCIRTLKKKDEVVGVALSGQMHGSVFLDEHGKIIRRALLWNDQRTVNQCEDIERAVGGRKKLIEWVSNIALTGYTAPKILWLREHEPQNFEKLKTVLLPKDFINFKMTGELSTEVSDASGTLLLDVKKRVWSSKILESLKLDQDLLPRIFESQEQMGTLSKSAAKELGLPAGIPVGAGAGDQAAGAIGMGVLQQGVASATIGTSGVVFAAVDSPFENAEGNLQSFCHAVPGKWCVFGCMLSAGASLTWFQSTFAKNSSISDLLKKMSPKPSSLLFLPYLEGERCPHPDSNAKGTFFGITNQSQMPDFTRAVLEGITFGMNEQIQILRRSGVSISEVSLGGGGAKSPIWQQLQADIYGISVKILKTENTSALGAALLAGVTSKVWRNLEEGTELTIKIAQKRLPSAKLKNLYQSKFAKYQSLYPALKELWSSEGI